MLKPLKKYIFEPNYRVHPRETVIDCRPYCRKGEENLLFIVDKYIVEGKKGRIDINLAGVLSKVFGPGKFFWLALQEQYDENQVDKN